ncbi:hypothetical protein [Deinococcus sp. 12RED42]|uniref:hypothetical protein n=1 Tax=Deinococcus sp. 12RED42 TaxID=2745872 RepID=UPI001E28F2A0|nr:hypothetical protein [Deinococcus sp. 12RED42]MCD0164584.1 hypothetical protein [Deinococcus sp. 12RED42]
MPPRNRVPGRQKRRVLRVLLSMSPLTTATLRQAFEFSDAHICTLAWDLLQDGLVRRIPAPRLQAHRSQGRAQHALVPAPIAALLIYRRPTPLRPTAHLIALSELVDGIFRDADALMLNRPQATTQAMAGAA